MSESTIARLQNEIVAQQALVCRQHATIKGLSKLIEDVAGAIDSGVLESASDSGIRGDEGDEMWLWPDEWLDLARKAIAKAKGADDA